MPSSSPTLNVAFAATYAIIDVNGDASDFSPFSLPDPSSRTLSIDMDTESILDVVDEGQTSIIYRVTMQGTYTGPDPTTST